MSTAQHTGQHSGTRLHPDVLDGLDPSVAVPSYDRSRVRTGIVHLGVGGFHRAHQAMYVDRLLEQGVPGAEEWGITGVGVLPGDARMAEVSAPGAVMTGADLSLATFLDSDLTDAVLAPVVLDRTNFITTKVTRIDL